MVGFVVQYVGKCALMEIIVYPYLHTCATILEPKKFQDFLESKVAQHLMIVVEILIWMVQVSTKEGTWQDIRLEALLKSREKIEKKASCGYEDLGREKKLITYSSNVQISNETAHKKADNESFLNISCVTNLGLERRNSDKKHSLSNTTSTTNIQSTWPLLLICHWPWQDWQHMSSGICNTIGGWVVWNWIGVVNDFLWANHNLR